MKKIYLSPATDVYKISIDGLLLTPSQDVGPGTSAAGDPNKIDTGEDGGFPSSGSGSIDDVDYARNSNGGNIWDNAW